MVKKSSDDKNRMIHIRMNEELHKKLRIRAAELDTTIQQWVEALIEKNLEKKK
jgi:predicted HicB family RNase H-like nuclease